MIFVPLNESIRKEFNQQLNLFANSRDYLIRFPNNLTIMTSNSIRLQATTLSQLIQSTNQLTRSSAVTSSFPFS